MKKSRIAVSFIIAVIVAVYPARSISNEHGSETVTGHAHSEPSAKHDTDGHTKAIESNSHSTEHVTAHENSGHTSGHSEVKIKAATNWANKIMSWTGVEWFVSRVAKKLDQLKEFDIHYEYLKNRVAVLEVENAELRNQIGIKDEGQRVAQIIKKSKEEGGSVGARSIASLHDQKSFVGMSPRSIYLTSVKSFNEKDFETSAKGFLKLAENEDNQLYYNAETMYYSGVSLYHLKNYKNAIKYLQRSVLMSESRKPASEEIESEHDSMEKRKEFSGDEKGYAPKAMAWLALCYHQVGEGTKEKRIIHELIQKYPKSQEARRLNRG